MVNFEKVTGGGMDTNPAIMAAAETLTAEDGIDEGPTKVPGFDGMFISRSGDPEINALSFLNIGNQRYAVGPLVK